MMTRLVAFILALGVLFPAYADVTTNSGPGGRITPAEVIVVSPKDTLTSGAGVKNRIVTHTSPATSTTRISVGTEIKHTYDGAGAQASGGYPNPLEVTQAIDSTASIDKSVVIFGKTDFLKPGTTVFGIGIEAGISAIHSGASIPLYAHFLTPNLRGLANINNITQLFSMLNQDTGAMWMNQGRTVDADYNEFAPAHGIGLNTGRIYSADITGNYSGTGVAANRVYFTFVQVPHRATIATLVLDITVGGAGNGRLALYKVGSGGVAARVAAGTEFSTASATTIQSTINTEVNAGTYAIAVTFSAANHQIRYHPTPPSNARVIGRSAIGNIIESAYIDRAYGALPSTFAGTALQYLSTGIEFDGGYTK